MKTRLGETKVLGNDILSVSIASIEILKQFCKSVFKTDLRKVNSSPERMSDENYVAVLREDKIMKTRLGETEILGNGISTLSMSSIETFKQFCKSVFKTDPRKVNSSFEQLLVERHVAVSQFVLCGLSPF